MSDAGDIGPSQAKQRKTKTCESRWEMVKERGDAPHNVLRIPDNELKTWVEFNKVLKAHNKKQHLYFQPRDSETVAIHNKYARFWLAIDSIFCAVGLHTIGLRNLGCAKLFALPALLHTRRKPRKPKPEEYIVSHKVFRSPGAVTESQGKGQTDIDGSLYGMPSAVHRECEECRRRRQRPLARGCGEGG